MDSLTIIEFMASRPRITSNVVISCPHKDRKPIARGLCGSCYGKWLKLVKPDFAAKQRAGSNAWRLRNPERVAELVQEAKDSGRRQKYQRKCDLRRSLNITIEEYDRRFEEQNGLCAICLQPETMKGKKFLAIDHCHSTGIVRGLLCSRCNTGLGWFKDNIELMKSAVHYLEKYNANHLP